MSVSNNKNSLVPGKNDPSSANQNLRHPIAAAPHQSLPTVRQTQYSIQTQNNHSFQYQQYQQYQQQYQYHPQLSMPTIQYHYHPYTTGGAVHWPQTQYYQQQQQVQVPTIQNFRAGTYQYGLIHQNYHWNAAQHLFSFPHLHQCQQLLAGTMIRPTLPPTLPKPLKVNPDQAVLKNETAIPKIEKVKAEPNTSTRSTLKPEQVSKSTKAYSSSSVAAVYVVRNNVSNQVRILKFPTYSLQIKCSRFTMTEITSQSTKDKIVLEL